MTTLFISDLHLDEAFPEIAERFLKFLSSDAKDADALYILGDFFEIWVGDDDLTPFNQKIIQALKTYTDSDIPTYFMHGNRDFLLSKRFLKTTGLQLLKDPSLIKLYGIPTLLMHGDLLCTKDTEYLAVRKKLRNPLRHFLFFLFKSLKKRKAFAKKLRELSKERYKTIDKEITDVAQNTVNAYMKRFDVQYLIHGHTHRPNIHHFELNGKPCVRAVLGSWHNSTNMLICKQTEDNLRLAFELKCI